MIDRRTQRPTVKGFILFTLLGALVFVLCVEGAARIYWAHLERLALAQVDANGQRILANGAINFIKESDPILGYRLKRNLNDIRFVTTAQGFGQREPVSIARKPNSLRIMAIGESTTLGHRVDSSYPTQLRQLLSGKGNYSGDVEVINAGVPGWISDQSALWAETELATYRPDIVLLYAGWNDFQAYSPLAPPPIHSYFHTAYGEPERFVDVSFFKSAVFAANLLASVTDQAKAQAERSYEFMPLMRADRWQPLLNARLARSNLAPPTDGASVGTAELPPGGYVYAGVQADRLADLRADEQVTATVFLRGQGRVGLKLNGLTKPWPEYRECAIELSEDWRRASCTIARPNDGKGLQVSIVNRDTTSVSAMLSAGALYAGSAPVAAKSEPAYAPEETYRFYLENLDRIVAAFRRQSPSTRFAIATLVGRWPLENEEQFAARQGHTWWMSGLSNEQAATYLSRFNDLIRRYAAKRGLLLIDLAAKFAPLDRPRLMRDFAHFSDDGYALLAENILDELVHSGFIRATVPADLAERMRHYAR